jgi:hypothetical protein
VGCIPAVIILCELPLQLVTECDCWFAFFSFSVMVFGIGCVGVVSF